MSLLVPKSSLWGLFMRWRAGVLENIFSYLGGLFFSPTTTFLDCIVELIQISGTGGRHSLAKNLT